MNQEEYDLIVGEACSRLLATPDFKTFLNHIEVEQGKVAKDTFTGLVEDFEAFSEKRAAYRAYSAIHKLPQQLADAAREIREQHYE